jgi:DNA-binding NtrC family response regulator
MSKCSILLVDDNEEFLSIFSCWLTRRGFSVTATSNPPTALAEAANSKFDLAIIDMNLPEMSGLELIDQLKRIVELPTIVLSGDDNPRLFNSAMDRGVFRYLLKPVSMRTVENVICEILQDATAASAHLTSNAKLESIS